MKRMFIIEAVLLLFSTQLSYSAHLVHLDGGFEARSDLFTRDENGTCDPSLLVHTDPNYAFSSQFCSVGFGTVSSEGAGQCIWTDSDVTAEIYAYLYGNSLFAQIANGQGRCSLEDAGTKGLFFQVVADNNEENGMPVTVRYHWIADIEMPDSANVSSTAFFSGGSDIDGLYLTAGLHPPVTSIPAENVVWIQPRITISDTSYFDEQIGTFTVQIGDVIGLFMTAELDVAVDLKHTSNFNLDNYGLLSMNLEVLPVITSEYMDFNHDHRIDLIDLSIFTQFWLCHGTD